MSIDPEFTFSANSLQDYVDCPRRFGVHGEVHAFAVVGGAEGRRAAGENRLEGLAHRGAGKDEAVGPVRRAGERITSRDYRPSLRFAERRPRRQCYAGSSPVLKNETTTASCSSGSSYWGQWPALRWRKNFAPGIRLAQYSPWSAPLLGLNSVQ